MSKKTKKKYTKEFKTEAVKLMREQGYSQTEASNRLGVPRVNLNRWEKESVKSDKKNTSAKKFISIEEKEWDELHKEIKRLKMEREILKKAAAFFANESN